VKATLGEHDGLAAKGLKALVLLACCFSALIQDNSKLDDSSIRRLVKVENLS
jgi:hypothetical protein